MSDTICLDPKKLEDPFFNVPNELASDPNYVKHVQCDGARFHVIHWDSNGSHCSCKNCIINKFV